MRVSLITFFLIVIYLSISAQNQNISNGELFDGEPYMILDPNNPSHLVVIWMGYDINSHSSTGLGIKTKVSWNGGKTWSNVQFLPHVNSSYQSADPSMAYDNTGKLFACYIDHRESPDSGGVYVIGSNDGGLTWGKTSKVIDIYADRDELPVDRPWLCVNPLNDHFYITTKPANTLGAPLPCRPYFETSSDTGRTWTPWEYIDSTGYLVGNLIGAPMAAPTVSADGSFHCIYPSYVLSQNVLLGFIHAKSINDGKSFVYSKAIYSKYPANDTLSKNGYRIIADPTDANHLVFIFLGQPYGDLDVFIIESTDAGKTWSSDVRVNDDAIGNGKMQVGMGRL